MTKKSLALAAVVAGIATSGVAQAPAQAFGNCTSGTPGAIWAGSSFSLQLIRTTSCHYFARFTMPGTWGVGLNVDFMVERQQVIGDRPRITGSASRSIVWGSGTIVDTAQIDGFPPTYSEQDGHHACYRFNGGAWDCTAMVGI